MDKSSSAVARPLLQIRHTEKGLVHLFASIGSGAAQTGRAPFSSLWAVGCRATPGWKLRSAVKAGLTGIDQILVCNARNHPLLQTRHTSFEPNLLFGYANTDATSPVTWRDLLGPLSAVAPSRDGDNPDQQKDPRDSRSE